MRKYKILFFLAPVFLLACNSTGTPKGILSTKEMVGLLVDIHIVDGTVSDVPQTPDTLYKYGFAKYQHAFASHHTDSAQFKKSFVYYTNRPDELLDIYDKVMPILKNKVDSSARVRVKADSLEVIKQTKLNAKNAKRKADSVAKATKRKADSLSNTPKLNSGRVDKSKLL